MDKIDDEILKKMLEEDRLKKMLEEESVEIEYLDKKLAEYNPVIEEPKVVEIKPHPFIEVKPQVPEINPPVSWKLNIASDPLKVCKEKFNNFKKLCYEIDAQNEWIIYFCKTVELSLFLYTIKSKLLLNPSITIDAIYSDILETSKLSDENIGKDRDRVKRYIEYFLAVIKTMD